MGIEIIDTNAENILEYGICGYKDIRKAGYPEKIEWLKDRFPEGMKIKTLFSNNDGTQGMIEYIPGEYAWRPIEASGITIHLWHHKIHKDEIWSLSVSDIYCFLPVGCFEDDILLIQHPCYC